MRKFCLFSALLLLATAAGASPISGDYLETRNADVFVAACMANSETGLVGDKAILAWHVREGGWEGQPLAGLSIVAVVKARATLGDPHGEPLPARALLIVDAQANPAERAALVSFARSMAGELLANVEKIMDEPISLRIEGLHQGRARLQAGTLAAVETRMIGEKDHLCGNEETYYSPLVSLVHAMPAVAVNDEFSGPGLDASWQTHNKPSAFIGTFAR